jgi:predicted SAM-dependent methyltransferase
MNTSRKLISCIPIGWRRVARSVRKAVRYHYRYMRLRLAVRSGLPLKIIVGAAETWQSGWYSTNEQWLDITNPCSWARIFKSRALISHVVAEHVFEHLTEQEAARALMLISKHMIRHGRIRIAVPDGYNPNTEYIRHVGINGLGDDAGDHKQLLNVESLSKLLIGSGFDISIIEGYDAGGILIKNEWCQDDGFVIRSRQNDIYRSWSFPDASTSLIIDGVLV